MESNSSPEDALVISLPGYCMTKQFIEMFVLFIIPMKPLAPKKSKQHRATDRDNTSIVQQITVMFNTRLDAVEKNVEKLITDNTMKI